MKKTSLLFAASSLSLGLLGLSGCGNNSSVATVADADVNETSRVELQGIWLQEELTLEKLLRTHLTTSMVLVEAMT